MAKNTRVCAQTAPDMIQKNIIVRIKTILRNQDYGQKLDNYIGVLSVNIDIIMTLNWLLSAVRSGTVSTSDICR